MNLNLFLANKIGSKADATGKLGRTGTILSIVSVALSIAVIIIAVAVSNGFRKEIVGKARGFMGDVVLTEPGREITGESGPVNADLSYLENLEELSFVDRVSGVSYCRGILKTNEQIGGVLLKGVDSTYNMDFFSRYLIEGNLPKLNGNRTSNEIIISRRVAQMMQYKVGDKITAYFVDNQVRVRRFDLVGIFDAQLDQFDKYLGIVDIRDVNRLNGWDNGVSGFEIFIDGDVSTSKSDALENVIYSKTTEDDTPLVATTLQDKYYILFDWLHLLDLNVIIILALMIAVAGFNMVSGLLIMLFERIAQIGLLKSLGMTDNAIARVFFTKSALVVLAGMVWGNIIAVALCLIQKQFNVITLDPANYFVSSVPVDFNFTWIVAMNLIAFVAIMLIMMLPCHFISRIDPAATMRVK